ncbi:MAG TPA: sigma 54-interacting transcriptional regulator [Candidatus Saccharimonadales bacterium]|nr:sigma 54-interacting transcriptional regulator [Candidatus Saccharimonadales bacterium]
MNFAGANFGNAVSYYVQALEILPPEAGAADRSRLLLKIADSHRLHGANPLALEALGRARALFDGLPPGPELGRVLARHAAVLNNCGRYQEAMDSGLQAYQLLRDSNENHEIGNLELVLGTGLARLGDFTAAREYFERALATFRRVESEEGQALAFNNLGLVAKSSGDLEGALRYLERALGINERLGNFARVITHCLNLGIVRFKLGEWDIAAEYLQRCLAMARDTDDSLSRVSALNSLACLHRRRRDFAAAEAALEESLRLATARGHVREQVLAMEFRGDLMLELDRLEDADRNYAAGLEAAERIAPEGDVVLEILRRQGDLRLRQGRVEEAEACGRRALDLARRQHDRLEEATCWRLLALVAGERGAVPDYIALMDQAVRQLSEVGERFELALTLQGAGSLERRLYEAQRQEHLADRAARHLRRASALFVSFDCEYYLAHATLELARLDLALGRLDQALAELEEALNYGGTFRAALEPAAAELRARLQEGYVRGSASPSNDFRLLEDISGMFREAPARDWSAGLVEMLAARLPAEAVFLAEAEGSDWVVRARRGVDAHAALHLAPALGTATAKGQPIFSTRAASDPLLPAEVTALLSAMGSVAALPFGVADQVRGLLFVGRTLKSPAGSLKQRELDLLVALTHLAAVGAVEARRQRLWEENKNLRAQLKVAAADGIVTQNPQMIEILSLVDKVSDATASVLVQGETGTGKGLIARAIHQRSMRRDRPFLPINCAALPEPLLESELFGHVSGAFTGAHRDKLGLLEEAEGGTVFLDEVDRLTEVIQGKLLHVLDRGEIRAVGSNRWKKVNVRVICATNADLKTRIAEGRFLEDLYYRLNDILIQVPPLRERREDIPLLADFFRRQFAGQFSKEVGEYTSEVRVHFLRHQWRGNVREMEKVVKRMVVLADAGAPLGVELLPEEFFAESHAPNGTRGRLWSQVADMERRIIAQTLEDAGWNKSQTARELGISYPALLQKVKLFGLDRRAKGKRVHR